MTVDLLQAARLSQQIDGQTGMESRDEEVRAWAVANEHKIVATAADYASGAKNPFERKELGPWLTDPHQIVQYQGIVGASIDRLSRDCGNLDNLKKWVEENGKTLFVVSPPLRWPIPKDDKLRMVYQIQWDLLAILAEAELAAISERYRKMKTFLKGNGTVWGRAMFGYEITGEPKSKTLTPTSEGWTYIPPVYQMCIDGKSCDVIAAWLTEQGVETDGHRRWAARPMDADGNPKPEPSNVWGGTTIRQIIRNPAYMGIVCERNWAAKAGTYGRQIMECAALVAAATWQRANDALAIKNGQKRKPSSLAPAMLHSGVLRCLNCGGAMYRMTSNGTRFKTRADGTRVRYRQNCPDNYRCRGGKPDWKGCGTMVKCTLVDEALDWWMSDNRGQIKVNTIIRGHTNREIELADIAYRLQQLPVQGLSRRDEQAERDLLYAEEDRLTALPDEPDRVETVPTGETYGSAWAQLPYTERTPWLKKNNKYVCASKTRIELREADGTRWQVIPFDQVGQMPPELLSISGQFKGRQD